VKTDYPSFSVIAPTYNRSEIVEETLRRLAAVDYPSDRYEVLVTDNSTDDTPQMVERMAASSVAPIRLISSAERLPAVKRNMAVEAANGEYALFINDDLWVEPDFLTEHASAHRRHPGPVAVLGLVEQSAQMPWTPFTEWYRPFAFEEIDDQEDRNVGWRYFWSMNISLPRDEMIRRNLLFHEDWRHIGHEDIELGYRWGQAGYRIVYHPAARGQHYHPHTLDSACRLQESIGKGLRDLEVLIPDPTLLERYGVFSWHNSGRAVARALVRQALFNGLTVPAAKRWLESLERNNRLSRWMYWKVLLHFTNRGYRNTAPSATRTGLTISATDRAGS